MENKMYIFCSDDDVIKQLNKFYEIYSTNESGVFFYNDPGIDLNSIFSEINIVDNIVYTNTSFL